MIRCADYVVTAISCTINRKQYKNLSIYCILRFKMIIYIACAIWEIGFVFLIKVLLISFCSFCPNIAIQYIFLGVER